MRSKSAHVIIIARNLISVSPVYRIKLWDVHRASSLLCISLVYLHYRIKSRGRFTRSGPPRFEVFVLVPTAHHKRFVKAATKCYIDPPTLNGLFGQGQSPAVGSCEHGTLSLIRRLVSQRAGNFLIN